MNFKKAALTIALVSSVFAINANAAEGTTEVTLQGLITTTTCNVTANQGNSVLDVGIFKSAEFTPNVQLGNTELVVNLADCPDTESGDLIITGVTAKNRAENDIFTSSVDGTVGFMIQDSAGNQVANFVATPLDVEEGAATYTFKVGMASTTVTPVAGLYSAPINVTYVTK